MQVLNILNFILNFCFKGIIVNTSKSSLVYLNFNQVYLYIKIYSAIKFLF